MRPEVRLEEASIQVECGELYESMIRLGPRSRCILCSLIFATTLIASERPSNLQAQTLARPGWVGSGLTAQTWFKHAIFYKIDAHTFASSRPDATESGAGDLKGITQHIDYIHSLGVDAILLDPLSAEPSPSAPIEPSLGTLDDFNDLTLQASRLRIRVLLELPAPDLALAQFWLTRGVAGFYIPSTPSTNAAALQSIRKLLPTYVGQRVLITDADSIPPMAAHSSSNELVLDRAIFKTGPSGAPTAEIVSDLRIALDQTQSLARTANPIVATAASTLPDPSLARVALAAVLLNRSVSLITAGQELGLTSPGSKGTLMPWGVAAPAVVEAVQETPEPVRPAAPISVPDKYTPYVPYVPPAKPKKPSPPDPNTVAGQDAIPGSLLNFYRQLSVLHHGATAIHDGDEITLNHDAQNALVWIRKPASSSQTNPPILIACNFSDKPVDLSLAPDLTRLQLRGHFLRTLLRSDDAMGGTSVDPLTLPSNGVYVGQLRD